MIPNLIQLTFYREPNKFGVGGGPTSKKFWINLNSIELVVRYDSDECTKIGLNSGREIYVVETPDFIRSNMD